MKLKTIKEELLFNLNGSTGHAASVKARTFKPYRGHPCPECGFETEHPIHSKKIRTGLCCLGTKPRRKKSPRRP